MPEHYHVASSGTPPPGILPKSTPIESERSSRFQVPGAALKIALNGYFLRDPWNGSGQHTQRLLEGLALAEARDEFHLLIPQIAGMEATAPLDLPSNFRTIF